MKKKTLKSSKSDKKFSKDTSKVQNKECVNERGRVIFSFCYMTSNPIHNFKYYKKADKNNELLARQHLSQFLMELSSNTWMEIGKRRKDQKCGIDSIPYNRIVFSPVELSPSEDSKVFSFRFGNADSFRLLGIKEKDCPVLHIIGYDFNFSAYDHGS